MCLGDDMNEAKKLRLVSRQYAAEMTPFVLNSVILEDDPLIVSPLEPARSQPVRLDAFRKSHTSLYEQLAMYTTHLIINARKYNWKTRLEVTEFLIPFKRIQYVT